MSAPSLSQPDSPLQVPAPQHHSGADSHAGVAARRPQTHAPSSVALPPHVTLKFHVSEWTAQPCGSRVRSTKVGPSSLAPSTDNPSHLFPDCSVRPSNTRGLRPSYHQLLRVFTLPCCFFSLRGATPRPFYYEEPTLLCLDGHLICGFLQTT